MEKDLRIAINELIEKLEYIDDIIHDSEYYTQSTTLNVKKEVYNMVKFIVSQDAEHVKQEGYIDDVKRVGGLLGLLTENERKM